MPELHELPVVVADLGSDVCRYGIVWPGRGNQQNNKDLWVGPSFETPQNQEQLFQQLGQQLLQLVDCTGRYLGAITIGLPGRVRSESSFSGIGNSLVGPLPHIQGMQKPIDFRALLVEQFETLSNRTILPINGAQARAYAAADIFAQANNNKSPLLYLKVGRYGVGGDIMIEFVSSRVSTGIPQELGHVALLQPDGSYCTLEQRISGTSIQNLYGIDVHNLQGEPTDEVGKAVMTDIARLLGMLTAQTGLKSIVLGGSVSINFLQQYESLLEAELERIIASQPPDLLDSTPQLYFPSAEQDATMGLLGCYLYTKRHFLKA